ncbi:unnamed protein product [Urochloa humidicola]
MARSGLPSGEQHIGTIGNSSFGLSQRRATLAPHNELWSPRARLFFFLFPVGAHRHLHLARARRLPSRFPHRKFKKMLIESNPQLPNGDASLLHSTAGGLVHSQSTKLQPYSTLKLPTHQNTLDPDYRPARHWRGEEEEEQQEQEEDTAVDDDESQELEEKIAADDDESQESKEMYDAEREEIRAFLKAHAEKMRRTAQERMTSLAEDCEYARKHRHATLIRPPLEMLEHPDLFERAWGWDMILPCDSTTPWPQFKKYLLAYYHHNQKEADVVGGADDEGNGLASLAHSCIKMEKHLSSLWNKYATMWPTDDLEMKQVIEKVTSRAQEMVDARKAEFPVAAIALKCITEEAELMCGWLRAENTSPIYYIHMGNEIRECALSLMVSKGPEYVLDMAAMMVAF